MPPYFLETTIVKSKLYHLPSSARDVDENLFYLGTIFFLSFFSPPPPRLSLSSSSFFFLFFFSSLFIKGRGYLLNVQPALHLHTAFTIASNTAHRPNTRFCLIHLLRCVYINYGFPTSFQSVDFI